VSLPSTSATARMRIWRALKALGCAALRDGAYLLPTQAGHAQSLQALADECHREAGTAWLMTVAPHTPDQAHAWRKLFDRAEAYAELRRSWQTLNRGLAAMSPPDLARLQRKVQREFDALRAVDFFPGDARLEAEAACSELSRRIAGLLAPDEPQQSPGPLPRLDPADYQGRTWATRRRLWVDRVASAWLIRRFIDHDARFQWLEKLSDCPKHALGFDFDGATFTHVGERVTFETLMASFGLDSDPGLGRLAGLVHVLDAGGDPVPEAAGFEAMMAGARERLADDDALLAEISRVLDSLHAHFTREAQRVSDKGPSR
jgi:hypothetical protein